MDLEKRVNKNSKLLMIALLLKQLVLPGCAHIPVKVDEFFSRPEIRTEVRDLMELDEKTDDAEIGGYIPVGPEGKLVKFCKVKSVKEELSGYLYNLTNGCNKGLNVLEELLKLRESEGSIDYDLPRSSIYYCHNDPNWRDYKRIKEGLRLFKDKDALSSEKNKEKVEKFVDAYRRLVLDTCYLSRIPSDENKKNRIRFCTHLTGKPPAEQDIRNSVKYGPEVFMAHLGSTFKVYHVLNGEVTTECYSYSDPELLTPSEIKKK